VGDREQPLSGTGDRAPENGRTNPGETHELLDDALRTAREALDDITRAKSLYGEFLDEVKLGRQRLEQREQEFRKTADSVVSDILGPAEASMAEILAIKQSLQDERELLRSRAATTARLQAELEKGKERIKRLQREKEEAETRAAALQRESQLARREIENIQARHAMEAEELAGLRTDMAALRDEIETVRADRDRFRTLLGSVRSALEDEGQIDPGNFPDVMENPG